MCNRVDLETSEFKPMMLIIRQSTFKKNDFIIFLTKTNY